ncbi:DUF423 domain-containing protein [bacterium]|jgi:uncharacterized membrane protein YgdD (TMEM256/DUF423 family)|nr:DUF423 domain-containing protein [bacterium]
MTSQIEKNCSRRIVSSGLFFAFLSILLGAFAAHGLKGIVSEYQLRIFQTSVRYMMWHSFGLTLYGMVRFYGGGLIKDASSFFPARLYLYGILLFCGSLFVLTFVNLPVIGAITPLGGLCFLAAWGSFMTQVIFSKK